MAAVVPVTDPSVSGFVEPGFGIFGGATARGTPLTTGGESIVNRNGYKFSVYYFEDVGSGDRWTNGLKQIIAAAWQPNRADGDRASPNVLTQATSTDQGVIQWDVDDDECAGWLWVLHGA